jgi:FKBP-type peptidyl-prolyl cis-trans isomerase 2
MAIATGDTVTVEFTGRLKDGTVFDTSRESVAEETGLAETQPERTYDPLTVEIGDDRVIQGLEDALIGLDEGATPTVTVPPEKGYGERRDDQIREFEAEKFREMVGSETPDAGDFIETQEGGLAEITRADDDVVEVDFNHQLAGESLEFDIEVLGVNSD